MRPTSAYGVRLYQNGSSLVMHHDKVCPSVRQALCVWLSARLTVCQFVCLSVCMCVCVCVCVCLSVRLYVCMYVCLFFNFYLTKWICEISILCRSLSLRIKIIFSLRHYSLLCFRLFRQFSSSQYFFLLRLVPSYLLLFYIYHYKHSNNQYDCNNCDHITVTIVVITIVSIMMK